jgi:hypothetical protein
VKSSLMVSILLIFVSVFAQAGIQQDYLELKDFGRNLQDTGAICEEVARLNKQKEYGNQYTIISGIEYADQDGTVGELDVVVFENRTNQVVQIGEVKCWKDMAAGLRKAHDQRQRFLKNVRSSKELHFSWKDDRSLRLTKQQFNKVTDFISIAQKGSKSVGYEMELDYSLGQLMDLRSMIMTCQSSGACKRPLH